MMINYVDGSQESARERLLRLLPLLACPQCKSELILEAVHLVCGACKVRHAIKKEVAILLPTGVPDPGAVLANSEDRVSRHPYSESALKIIDANTTGWVLDLGAGGKVERRKNVVQIDIFRYPSVDVVGSADCLPFIDNAFDAIISQAVFEHLQYPEWAVAEIRRVLKPGGIAKIDTAFLQPEHGFPHHFYNATETGLRHWFRDFEIEWSGVEPFQQPKWALHWFLGVYLDFIGEDEARVLREIPVGHLADLLQRHSEGDIRPGDAIVSQALDALPIHLQRVLAAGVSVHAVNPPKHVVDEIAPGFFKGRVLDREREMAQLRAESGLLSAKLTSTEERLKIAIEKANYLSLFYPGAKNLARLAALWVDPVQAGQFQIPLESQRKNSCTRAFASIIAVPREVSPLLDLFFSLTNQRYAGWELICVVGKGTPVGVRKAIHSMALMDARVILCEDKVEGVALLQSGVLCARGEYYLVCPDGVTLAKNALQEVISAARHSPNVHSIAFDFSVRRSGGNEMRCHAQPPRGIMHVDGEATAVDPSFKRVGAPSEIATTTDNALSVCHIPLVLASFDRIEPALEGACDSSIGFVLEQHDEISEDLKQQIDAALERAQEDRILGGDVANYLSQFYPESKNLAQLGFRKWVRRQLARTLRRYLPLTMWNPIFKLVLSLDKRRKVDVSVQRAIPFVSIIFEPSVADELIRTFFSLVHQSYTGWELILIQTHDQSPAVSRALHDFSNLDRRVTVVNGANAVSNRHHNFARAAQGEFVLMLGDGVTFAFNAIETAVTLARSLPRTDAIVSDFDRLGVGARQPMKCFNSYISAASEVSSSSMFSATFFRKDLVKSDNTGFNLASSVERLPLCLFHRTENT